VLGWIFMWLLQTDAFNVDVPPVPSSAPGALSRAPGKEGGPGRDINTETMIHMCLLVCMWGILAREAINHRPRTPASSPTTCIATQKTNSRC
jgi:hypothetical protein